MAFFINTESLNVAVINLIKYFRDYEAGGGSSAAQKEKATYSKNQSELFFLIHNILLIFIDSSQLKVENVLSIIK